MKKKQYIIQEKECGYFELWSDLSRDELKEIEGVRCVYRGHNCGEHLTFRIAPRYDRDEVLAIVRTAADRAYIPIAGDGPKAFVLEKHTLISEAWFLWSDLTKEQAERIEGIAFASSKCTGKLYLEFNPRYNEDEVAERVREAAEKAFGKVGCWIA